MGFEILLCALVEFRVFGMLYHWPQTQALQSNTEIIKQHGAGGWGEGEERRQISVETSQRCSSMLYAPVY